ncbi:MAG TPA: ATP-binding protein [Abditibacterium sp.]
MSSVQLLKTLENFPAPYFLWQESAARGAPNAHWRATFSSDARWSEVLHPDDFVPCQQLCQSSQPWRREVRLRVENGWKRCLLVAEPLFDAPQTWLLGATDIEAIVERIEAQCEQERVALRMTARQWSSFFQKSATGKAMIGLGGEFLAVNPELCRLLDYDEDALLQIAPHKLRHPDDAPRIEAVYAALLAGGPAVSGVTMRYFRSDGQVIHALLSLSLVHDSRGQALYFAVEMQDDSARRRAEAALQEKIGELASSNAELARSNAELERFAFIASHDLQEPLRKIRVFSGRLQSEAAKTQLSDAARDYLTRLSASAERMQQLVGDLLEFARLRRPPRRESVDLTLLARQAAADFEIQLLESGGRIEIGALPTLEGDRSRLSQLLCNLIGNALKFRGAAPPHVQIWAQLVARQSAETECWEFFVRDNGIGFDEADWPRLLEVFGRLHPREQFPGTGIGLAICRKVVEEHGGELSAQSRPGAGATFRFTLPARQKAV